MKYLLLFTFLYAQLAAAQSKSEQKSLKRIKTAVGYLSDDKLEGRRTGTAGEKLAANYISREFQKAGLQPSGDNGSFLQAFPVSEKDNRSGYNVIGILNNKAPHTIVLGAHYDHLGYGEDRNSFYTAEPKMVHNGADDNASGVAALIELANTLKKSGDKKHNYLFVAFSGEELGLFGSKYFTEHSPIPITSINYMVNMDMVGRLNDSTKAITVGGYGTSPEWGKLVQSTGDLKITYDSSGVGPSDHTSFYLKDIPVLFFFTGTHMDYHRPSDDAEKINYEGIARVTTFIQYIIKQTDPSARLSFSKTRDLHMGKSSFKVSLGILPDYTFSGTGVHVDGVTAGRPAEQAGILKGDIILQLGEHKTDDVQLYMQALNKFDKGQLTNAKIKRGDKELILPVTF